LEKEIYPINPRLAEWLAGENHIIMSLRKTDWMKLGRVTDLLNDAEDPKFFNNP